MLLVGVVVSCSDNVDFDENQSDEVQKTYDQFPTTISNALQKIATSWQILIGEMDQASGASATVAQALSTIADNLGILKVFFDDVGVGCPRDKVFIVSVVYSCYLLLRQVQRFPDAVAFEM